VPFLLRLLTNSDSFVMRDMRRQVLYALLSGGLGRQAAEEMDVAVGEVLSNANRHAYHGDIGPVRVGVFRSERAASVVVVDDGEAMKTPEVPRSAPPPTSDGGRGLYLARQLTDGLAIRVSKKGSGLVVWLTKRLKPDR
jgi:serine/threonine-protein kinase RsbW